MRRNLFLIIGIFLAIFAFILLGNIIVIGDKLGQLTHIYVEYAFYIVLLLLVGYYLIRPIIRVHRAPEIPIFAVDGDWDTKQVRDFARQLAVSCGYISDNGLREKHKRALLESIQFHSADEKVLRTIISEEINLRLEGSKELNILGINKRIKEWGKTVFMITAISQNSKFDSLSVMYMNYKMIEDIILSSGFRPDNRQMFKMYVNILSTALITYCMSEALSTTSSVAPFDFGDFNENAGAEDIASSAVESGLDTGEAIDTDIDFSDEVGDTEGLSIYTILRRIRIPGVVVGSAIDGTLNALMTLRIGYITRTYLQQGSAAFSGVKNKRAIKRQAMKDAVIAVPAVILSGSHVIGKKATDFVLNLILRKDTSKKEDVQSENVE